MLRNASRDPPGTVESRSVTLFRNLVLQQQSVVFSTIVRSRQFACTLFDSAPHLWFTGRSTCDDTAFAVGILLMSQTFPDTPVFNMPLLWVPSDTQILGRNVCVVAVPFNGQLSDSLSDVIFRRSGVASQSAAMYGSETYGRCEPLGTSPCAFVCLLASSWKHSRQLSSVLILRLVNFGCSRSYSHSRLPFCGNCSSTDESFSHSRSNDDVILIDSRMFAWGRLCRRDCALQHRRGNIKWRTAICVGMLCRRRHGNTTGDEHCSGSGANGIWSSSSDNNSSGFSFSLLSSVSLLLSSLNPSAAVVSELCSSSSSGSNRSSSSSSSLVSSAMISSHLILLMSMLSSRVRLCLVGLKRYHSTKSGRTTYCMKPASTDEFLVNTLVNVNIIAKTHTAIQLHTMNKC